MVVSSPDVFHKLANPNTQWSGVRAQMRLFSFKVRGAVVQRGTLTCICSSTRKLYNIVSVEPQNKM